MVSRWLQKAVAGFAVAIMSRPSSLILTCIDQSNQVIENLTRHCRQTNTVSPARGFLMIDGTDESTRFISRCDLLKLAGTSACLCSLPPSPDRL